MLAVGEIIEPEKTTVELTEVADDHVSTEQLVCRPTHWWSAHPRAAACVSSTCVPPTYTPSSFFDSARAFTVLFHTPPVVVLGPVHQARIRSTQCPSSWMRDASLVRRGAYGARMERVFKRLGHVLTEIMLSSRRCGGGFAALAGPGEAQLSRRRKPYEGNLTEKERERVSVETCASEPGHAAGRLRARCGSNALQSCVPATALSS